ncbi:FliO/MopB family protein [Frondihabitans australicus]|uniref:Flagellar protein FliO/FliZ n=1 Tax=Frondihabitans australicus TaxID=386892 RepID=A0A495IHQ0_9MICO|nr:flagellar biosynthetic protein FliO [Frondihabitans australicus]RKR75552.1 flagellar protein FliO/FliZ [Frondihabitans australicus]
MDTLFVGLRVVVSLGAVLALLWVIQRKVSKSGSVAKKAKHISVVARQGISGKASVAVIDVDGARYVLGVTEQSVNVLSVGEAPQEARVTPIAPVAPAAPSFAETLAAQATSTATTTATTAGTAVVAEPAPAAPVALSPRRAARAAAAAPAPATSPVAGSILSAATWKQAAAAMRQQRRA